MNRLLRFFRWLVRPPAAPWPPPVDSDRAVRGIGWAGDRPVKLERKPP